MSRDSFMSAANREDGMTIIDEWPNVKAPPAPQLKTVTIDPETTALLILDAIVSDKVTLTSTGMMNF